MSPHNNDDDSPSGGGSNNSTESASAASPNQQHYRLQSSSDDVETSDSSVTSEAAFAAAIAASTGGGRGGKSRTAATNKSTSMRMSSDGNISSSSEQSNLDRFAAAAAAAAAADRASLIAMSTSSRKKTSLAMRDGGDDGNLSDSSDDDMKKRRRRSSLLRRSLSSQFLTRKPPSSSLMSSSIGESGKGISDENGASASGGRRLSTATQALMAQAAIEDKKKKKRNSRVDLVGDWAAQLRGLVDDDSDDEADDDYSEDGSRKTDPMEEKRTLPKQQQQQQQQQQRHQQQPSVPTSPVQQSAENTTARHQQPQRHTPSPLLNFREKLKRSESFKGTASKTIHTVVNPLDVTLKLKRRPGEGRGDTSDQFRYELLPQHTGNNRVGVMVDLQLPKFMKLDESEQQQMENESVSSNAAVTCQKREQRKSHLSTTRLCQDIVNTVEEHWQGRFLVQIEQENDIAGYFLLSQNEAVQAVFDIFRFTAEAEQRSTNNVVAAPEQAASNREINVTADTTSGGMVTSVTNASSHHSFPEAAKQLRRIREESISSATLGNDSENTRSTIGSLDPVGLQSAGSSVMSSSTGVPVILPGVSGADQHDVHKSAIASLQRRKQRQYATTKISNLVSSRGLAQSQKKSDDMSESSSSAYSMPTPGHFRQGEEMSEYSARSTGNIPIAGSSRKRDDTSVSSSPVAGQLKRDEISLSSYSSLPTGVLERGISERSSSAPIEAFDYYALEQQRARMRSSSLTVIDAGSRNNQDSLAGGIYASQQQFIINNTYHNPRLEATVQGNVRYGDLGVELEAFGNRSNNSMNNPMIGESAGMPYLPVPSGPIGRTSTTSSTHSSVTAGSGFSAAPVSVMGNLNINSRNNEHSNVASYNTNTVMNHNNVGALHLSSHNNMESNTYYNSQQQAYPYDPNMCFSGTAGGLCDIPDANEEEEDFEPYQSSAQNNPERITEGLQQFQEMFSAAARQRQQQQEVPRSNLYEPLVQSNHLLLPSENLMMVSGGHDPGGMFTSNQQLQAHEQQLTSNPSAQHSVDENADDRQRRRRSSFAPMNNAALDRQHRSSRLSEFSQAMIQDLLLTLHASGQINFDENDDSD